MLNKFSIEGSFPSQPDDTLYKMSIYLQVWKPVARRKDRGVLELTISRIRDLHSAIQVSILLVP
jgi:hypothetical protein